MKISLILLLALTIIAINCETLNKYHKHTTND